MRLQEFGVGPAAQSIQSARNCPDYHLVTRILDSVDRLPIEDGPAGHWINRDFPHKMMLTLLGYSYAGGILRSDEIADQMSVNPALRYIASGRAPAASLIRSFRRGHRAQIERILGDLFGGERATAILSAAIMLDSFASEH